MRNEANHSRAARQRGISLLVGLVMLGAVSLLAFGFARSLLAEQHIVSNQTDRQLAFQRAERALKTGETFVQGRFADGVSDADFSSDCPKGLCKASGDTPAWELAIKDVPVLSRAASSGIAMVYPAGRSLDAAEARYIVEHLGKNDDGELFRVTARGFGRNENTRVTLQSYYLMP